LTRANGTKHDIHWSISPQEVIGLVSDDEPPTEAHPLARSTDVKHDRGITGAATPAPDASDEESEAHRPVRATGRSGRSIIRSIPDDSDEDIDAHIHKKTRRSTEAAYEEDCLATCPPCDEELWVETLANHICSGIPEQTAMPKDATNATNDTKRGFWSKTDGDKEALGALYKASAGSPTPGQIGTLAQALGRKPQQVRYWFTYACSIRMPEQEKT
jgi:hypothetical protein